MGPGYQIFRAKAGTVPIFSDSESHEEVLQRNRMMSGKWASIFGILLVIWFIVTNVVDLGFITVMVMVGLMVCFVFTFFPFVGLSRSLKKMRK